MKRLRIPVVVDTVTYFPGTISMNVVTPGADETLTRYPFAVSDFRD